MTTYTIEYHDLGMVIVGSIPASDFGAIAKLAEARGYGQMYPGIGSALGGDRFVFSSKKEGEQWLKQLEGAARKDNRDWLMSGDTGISSKAIYCVMTGKYNPNDHRSWGLNIPRDPSDFGRCHRLLTDWYPEWLPRLGEMTVKYPYWGPMVREWAKMTNLYMRDLASGHCEELYSLMKELEVEASK